MKKLIITMLLVLLAFGTPISAWAAPATQDTSCQAGYQYDPGADTNAFLDSLKSYGLSNSTQAGRTNGVKIQWNASPKDLKSYGLYITNNSAKNTDNTSHWTQYNNLNDLLKKYGISVDRPKLATGKPAPAPDGNDTVTPSPSDDTDNLSYEEQVVALVNEQREANELKPLTLSNELSDVARAKSQDMHDKNYFSHTSPTYGSPFDMMKEFGISYRSAGENIAMGYATPEAVVKGWMNSSGHRANILNNSYTQIGVGYVADGHYWTQLFTD